MRSKHATSNTSLVTPMWPTGEWRSYQVMWQPTRHHNFGTRRARATPRGTKELESERRARRAHVHRKWRHANSCPSTSCLQFLLL